MKTVISILEKRQHYVNRISPDCSLRNALSYMNSYNVECLAVTDGKGLFLGLVTEHDIARKTSLDKHLLSDTTVQEVINTEIPFVDINETVGHCMRLMKRFHIRYLPVFDLRSFRGIISSDDILEEAIFSRAGIFDEG